MNQWSDRDFRIGHDEVDAQHAHILKLAYSLSDRQQSPDVESVEIILQHLVRFIKWHFTTEEAVMAARNYPLLDQHRTEHRSCMERLEQLTSDYGRTHFIDANGLVAFLNEWLERHTLRSDRMFLHYVRQEQST